MWLLLFLLPTLVSTISYQNSIQLGGPCNNGQCPNGWSCSDNHCLPLQDPIESIGPCLENREEKCPWGYHCLVNSCYRNPAQHMAIGPCESSRCPEGFYCFIGECMRYQPTYFGWQYTS